MYRVQHIRHEEKLYHDHCYENYKLFEQGSWLHRPVQTVMDMLSLFENQKDLKVLDLGSGVGRNSIPVAQKIKNLNGQVVCVDFLESATSKLEQYALENHVENELKIVKEDIGEFDILPGTFDYIVAVSSLEHVASEEVFERVLARMVEGTKDKGINCLIVNSEVAETEIKTGKRLEAMMEVNLSTENLLRKLKAYYKGWHVLKELVKPLEYRIIRDDRQVSLKTNAITFVVQRRG
ncbi:class I SAM-dependent methyltransferase [Bacillus carboniphilus]|uniref:class I SAM-dependent methyltransferase n=1 Tax=Bacillus carboniphilus TaxID=86663 RepID=UPI0031DFC061